MAVSVFSNYWGAKLTLNRIEIDLHPLYESDNILPHPNTSMKIRLFNAVWFEVAIRILDQEKIMIKIE